jgi:hypothetical protein
LQLDLTLTSVKLVGFKDIEPKSYSFILLFSTVLNDIYWVPGNEGLNISFNTVENNNIKE